MHICLWVDNATNTTVITGVAILLGGQFEIIIQYAKLNTAPSTRAKLPSRHVKHRTHIRTDTMKIYKKRFHDSTQAPSNIFHLTLGNIRHLYVALLNNLLSPRRELKIHACNKQTYPLSGEGKKGADDRRRAESAHKFSNSLSSLYAN